MSLITLVVTLISMGSVKAKCCHLTTGNPDSQNFRPYAVAHHRLLRLRCIYSLRLCHCGPPRHPSHNDDRLKHESKI